MKAHFRMAAALLGVGMLLGSANALAQYTPWYLGASIGQSKSDGFCREQFANGATSCDNNGELAKLTASPPRVDVRAQALEATAVGTWWVWPEVGVYGKLGLFNRYARFSSPGGSGKDENTNYTYGAGARYDLNPQVAFRMEWQRYNDDFTTQVYSFGVLVKF